MMQGRGSRTDGDEGCYMHDHDNGVASHERWCCALRLDDEDKEGGPEGARTQSPIVKKDQTSSICACCCIVTALDARRGRRRRARRRPRGAGGGGGDGGGMACCGFAVSVCRGWVHDCEEVRGAVEALLWLCCGCVALWGGCMNVK